MSFPLKSTDRLQENRVRNSLGNTGETPMTFKGTFDKTLMLLGFTLVFAVVGWFVVPLLPVGVTLSLSVALIVLAIVTCFINFVPMPLILTVLVLQGVLVGAISRILENDYQGIVLQALAGTSFVLFISIAVIRSEKFRLQSRGKKILGIVLASYGALCLLNFGLMITGISNDPWGLRGAEIFGIPLGIFIGAFAVVLASITFITEVHEVEDAVEAGIPDKYGWQFAFSISLTIIWIYIEILRIIALARK